MDAKVSAETVQQQARADYYQRLERLNMKPLWEVLANLVPPTPHTDVQSAIWRWTDIAPFLTESGELISAKEAERRVLVLENPGLAGQHTCTNTMYAGMQLIRPGEVAPAHRHTQSALRFVVDGEGAYTAVDGERVTMRPGDFIITPKWTWHDHGNPGVSPVVWLDGLDVNVVKMLGAQFRENLHEDVQGVSRPEGHAMAKFGSNMLPMGYAPKGGVSPIFCYPYDQSKGALMTLASHTAQSIHRCHGVKMQYVNPATGGAPIPTMGTFLQHLPKGFSGAPYRSTDAAVFHVVEGEGRIEIEGEISRSEAKSFSFSAKDTFVVPSWAKHRLSSSQGAVLFSFSDRPIQLALHLWRELEAD
jgi:gentisate 1,2-dioxygenase